MSSGLSRPDRRGHREAAQDQHQRVDGPQRLVEVEVRVLEDRRMVGAVDRVGAEQPGEEQDLGRQKQPHPQLARRELLRRRIKMMCQVRVVRMLGFRADGCVRHRIAVPQFPICIFQFAICKEGGGGSLFAETGVVLIQINRNIPHPDTIANANCKRLSANFNPKLLIKIMLHRTKLV